MQFKYPEILYFLALLIIPILVHLFQLQRYKKVSFTNVAFLQKINTENRKSSRIKKWLILATRLGLLSAIILAFSQPYFGTIISEEKQNSFIYLDNSLSTNTKGEKGNLLQIASQELIEAANNNTNYSLLTNTNFHKNLTSTELKEVLLKTKNVAKKVNFKDVLLQIETQNKIKTKDLTNTILISDFQNIENSVFTNVNSSFLLIQQLPEQKNNIAIDSVYINNNTNTNFTINARISNQGEAKENIPLAIFNNEKLISKQTFSVEKDNTQIVSFSIEKTADFSGKLTLSFNDTFNFDNEFYFSINSNEKTSVMAIGNDNDFLGKIYTENDFNFTNYSLKNTNYNSLEKQQLIILNELEIIPTSLINTLATFAKKGGEIAIIPHENLNLESYNLLFKNLSAGKISPQQKDSLKITSINFNHPLFKNVFDKKVSNFQYPAVKNHFPSTFSNASNLISFDNKEGFIKQIKLANSNLFWVASPLNKKNSNFTNSPLIVPVFYNIGQQSLQLAELNYIVNETNNIELKKELGKDDILTIKNKHTSFIPLQKNNQSKITITTEEQPLENGFYHVLHKKDTLNTIAFNYNKEESSLQYLDVKKLADNNNNIKFSSSIKESLQKINKKNEVQWLWKLFLILTIVSLLLEILILKYFKV